MAQPERAEERINIPANPGTTGAMHAPDTEQLDEGRKLWNEKIRSMIPPKIRKDS